MKDGIIIVTNGEASCYQDLAPEIAQYYALQLRPISPKYITFYANSDAAVY
jgi:hypothetical protein